MIVPTIDVRAIDSNSTTVSLTDTKNFQTVFEYFRAHLQLISHRTFLYSLPPRQRENKEKFDLPVCVKK
jgi:hypothetical protein